MRNFTKRDVSLVLPKAVTWSARSLKALNNPEDVFEVQQFLMSSPWTFQHKGRTLFVGSQMAWHVVLALLMYLDIRSSLEDEGALSYLDLTRVITQFREYLRQVSKEYEYPGIGPSCKYGVASSREAYLYSIIAYEQALVDLLLVVQRLVSLLTRIACPTPITDSIVARGRPLARGQPPRARRLSILAVTALRASQ